MTEIFLLQHLSSSTVTLLSGVQHVARDRDAVAYLVGGCVRDLLLGLPAVDIDVSVDEHVKGFAWALWERWSEVCPELPQPRKPVVFKNYLTAKLSFDAPLSDGLDCLDLASLRKETYASSGERPDISSGTLADDLFRRDFSVNAMAIALTAENVCQVIDMHNGQRDLSDNVLRVLHERSYYDDPARLLRTIRFAVRLDASLEPVTQSLFADAVRNAWLGNLPPRRLGDEFLKCLSEQNAARVLQRLADEALLKQIDPEISESAIAAVGDRDCAHLKGDPLAIFRMLYDNDPKRLAAAAKRFDFRVPQRAELLGTTDDAY